MDHWFMAAVGKGGNMAGADLNTKDPMRRFCLITLRNIPVQTAAVLLLVTQAILMNLHLVKETGNSNWHYFFIADGFIVIAIVLGFHFREWRIDNLAARHKEGTMFQKGLPFAALSWLVYAINLGVRVAVIFKGDLHTHTDISALKIYISLTAVVCVLFTSGHHHRNESLVRRATIMTLVKTFMIDILDNVDLLDSLYDAGTENKVGDALEDAILVIVTLNFIRPSLVLVSLFIDHFASVRTSVKIKIFKAVTETAIVNLPLMGIRIYMKFQYDELISVFLVKNALAILYAIMEVYDSLYELRSLHEEKKAAKLEEQQKEANISRNNNGFTDETSTMRYSNDSNSHEISF